MDEGRGGMRSAFRPYVLCLDHRPSIGSKNDHSYRPGGKILLERNVLVAGYENLYACLLGLIEQIPVQQLCPTHLVDGADIMCPQDLSNAYWHILVKKDLGHESWRTGSPILRDRGATFRKSPRRSPQAYIRPWRCRRRLAPVCAFPSRPRRPIPYQPSARHQGISTNPSETPSVTG
jgi:hypothetical protein